jgi:hypothetical protein
MPSGCQPEIQCWGRAMLKMKGMRFPKEVILLCIPWHGAAEHSGGAAQNTRAEPTTRAIDCHRHRGLQKRSALNGLQRVKNSPALQARWFFKKQIISYQDSLKN